MGGTAARNQLGRGCCVDGRFRRRRTGANSGLPTAWVKADNLAVLYSFATGFLAYFALAKLGLEPSTVDLGEPTRSNAGSVSAVSQNG